MHADDPTDEAPASERAAPGPSARAGFADPEGGSCPGEPTDTSMEYGELLTCEITPVGDTDVFRFQGVAGERVHILASRLGGGNPYIALIRPDGSAVGEHAGSDFAVLGPTLDVSGTHRILVGEGGNNGTLTYTLALNRLRPLDVSAALLCSGCTVSDAIDPVGDVDLFHFAGTAGSTINVLASRQSGGNPYIALLGPDGNALGEHAGSDFAVLGAKLEVSGTHAVLVGEGGNNGTLAYSLSL